VLAFSAANVYIRGVGQLGVVRKRSVLRLLWEGIESVVLAPLLLGAWPVGRMWWSNYGSTREERAAGWAGDCLLGAGAEMYTRAIAIDAPPQVAWAWLVQLGLDRAGFYSYELMERALGMTVTNYEYIDPAWQTRSTGDLVLFHPKQPPIPVAHADEGVCLCFAQTAEQTRSGTGWSWSLYVQPDGAPPHTRCRLVVRNGYARAARQSWLRSVLAALEAPLDFLMERRMLRTLKRLAESTPRLVG
jgi:hypothetical protein